MHLSRLSVTSFKNCSSAVLECASKWNVIAGLNGMGKTNLLDAIHVVCLTKSHFNTPDSSLVQQGAAFFRLDSLWSLAPHTAPPEHLVVKYPLGKKKTIERNGKAYERISEHIGLLPVVMLTPDDGYRLLGASEERRRLLDAALSQATPEYLPALVLYNRLLDQRNALLKRALETRTSPDPTLLDYYDAQLLVPADYLHRTRADFTTRLAAIFAAFYERIAISNSQAEGVAIVYRSQLSHEPFLSLLSQSRDRDRATGRTHAGIHRDDLELLIDVQQNPQPLKRFASQGQIKSFVLALHLALYELLYQTIGTPPVLLLDDLFDKLDARRMQHLLELLAEPRFGQIFLTDTHTERLRTMIKAIDNTENLVQYTIQNGEAQR